MNNLMKPLAQLFKSAPIEAIPKPSSMAYSVLKKLSDGQLHTRDSLIKECGESVRSGIQSLRGDSCQNWLIHSIEVVGERKTLLQLDPRHLSGDSKLDGAARRQRKQELKKRSYKQASHEARRIDKALLELNEAQKEYLIGLGEAANDTDTKEPHS